jgi:putative CocE/NonD family hydrolase
MGARSEVWQRYLANLENAAFWRSRSYQPDLPKSRFPMLHVTGWYDGTLGGSLQNFTAMRARASAEAKAGQYLLIGPWRHWIGEDSRSTTVEGVSFGEASKVALHRQYRAWFERWLSAKTDAIAAWPRVRLFAMGQNRWLAGDDWPLPGTRFVSYYLSGGKAGVPRAGSLLAEMPMDGADRYDYDPKDPTPFLWHRNVDSGGPDDYRSVEARSDVLVYTMPTPARPMTVCGPVSATIVASSSARDVDVVARLSLVHADGTSQRLTDGWVRARARNGEFRNDPLTPGKAETYHLDLWGTCVALTPGQTLRLSVMSGAFPLVTPNLDTGGPLGTERTPVVAHQAVYHERGRLSSVTLPIVDAPRWIEVR